MVNHNKHPADSKMEELATLGQLTRVEAQAGQVL